MRFGTDGVRGVANAELTPEFALSLARAAGLCAEGRTVELLGVLPTPAVACLSALDGVGAAVISGSHNPYADNGIKLFAPGGLKLGDDVQAAIEAELAGGIGGGDRTSGTAVGSISHVEGRATERYEESVLAALD